MCGASIGATLIVLCELECLSMINWTTPSPAQIPASLAKCGQEKLFADEHAEILVDKYCATFHPYQGEEQIYTYGNKAIVVDQGKPTYAEFAALSLFREEGWNGMWVDGYRRRKRSSLLEDAQYPESIRDLLNSLSSRTGRTGGVFDLILWRDQMIMFMELKRSKRDRINQNQIDWVKAALSYGIDLHCFGVLEWQLSAP